MAARTRRPEPWLAGLAVAIILGLQEGTLARPLGDIGTTRAADWLDLLVPWAILGCAAVVVAGQRPRGAAWWLFGVGGLLFVQGHGIHLAANSIANAAGGDTAYLWDEVVGHLLLFTGLALVLAAVFVALGERAVHVNALGWLLTAGVALALFNSWVEGQSAILGLLVCTAFLVAGWPRRAQPRGRIALVTFTLAGLLLLGWGAYWRGFPEFSELGWI